jgi:16S rRNA (cytidine1402-2'-O)-methyltransferase
MVLPQVLPETLLHLSRFLGSRPLVVVAARGNEPGEFWRGALEEAGDCQPDPEAWDLCVLCIGAARQETSRWEEDRLRVELARCLGEGMGTKEASRGLAAESGWPRREIYRLAVGVARDA